MRQVISIHAAHFLPTDKEDGKMGRAIVLAIGFFNCGIVRYLSIAHVCIHNFA